jgi:glucose uptake protein GlcU
MQTDLVVYGTAAALAWGIYVVLLKFSSNPNYLGLPWNQALLGLSIGVLMVPLVMNLLPGLTTASGGAFSTLGFIVALVAGILWALGLTVVLKALNAPGTDVSRLVVVYNLNTLIAVVLGLFVLKEVPNADNRVEVIIGALLSVAGAFLVTRGT